MKKYLVVAGLFVGLCVNSLSADALKNSLTNMLNEKDTSSMVDLSRIDLNGKPKPVAQVKQTRSSKAVVATVSGHKIFKKDADDHLKKRTQGKMSNFDHLPKEQRLRIIQEMALPILASQSAEKELSFKEKETIYVRLWMQKEATKIKITDDQIKEVYDKLKQQSEESSSSKPIPSFESIKDKMRSQMIEKRMMTDLMKDAKITIQ